MSLEPSPVRGRPRTDRPRRPRRIPQGESLSDSPGELGPVFRDGDFADLYQAGQPHCPPWKLARAEAASPSGVPMMPSRSDWRTSGPPHGTESGTSPVDQGHAVPEEQTDGEEPPGMTSRPHAKAP